MSFLGTLFQVDMVDLKQRESKHFEGALILRQLPVVSMPAPNCQLSQCQLHKCAPPPPNKTIRRKATRNMNTWSHVEDLSLDVSRCVIMWALEDGRPCGLNSHKFLLRISFRSICKVEATASTLSLFGPLNKNCDVPFGLPSKPQKEGTAKKKTITSTPRCFLVLAPHGPPGCSIPAQGKHVPRAPICALLVFSD